MSEANPRNLQKIVEKPNETLDVEIKGWLNLKNPSDKSQLAKAMVALANHGGGIIILGLTWDGSAYARSQNEPARLGDVYNQDLINGIVEKYSDPAFHIEVQLVNTTGSEIYPVIVVPGGHGVPIQTKKGGPSGSDVAGCTIYIRRPGPKSEVPQTAAEWGELMQRCLLNRKDQLLGSINALLMPTNVESPSQEEAFTGWLKESDQRLKELYKPAIEAGKTPFKHGYWRVVYAVLDHEVELSQADLQKVLEQSSLRITGWPEWVCLNPEDLKPYPYEGLIECHVGDGMDSSFSATSDFWRASTALMFVLYRGYQEDMMNDKGPPGTMLDFDLPIWRTCEALLHARRVTRVAQIEDARIHFYMQWICLRGRSLQAITNARRFIPFPEKSRQDMVEVSYPLDVRTIPAQIVEHVRNILVPLYTVFDFFELTDEHVQSVVKHIRLDY